MTTLNGQVCRTQVHITPQENALSYQHQSPSEEGGCDRVQKNYRRMKSKGVPRVRQKPSPFSSAQSETMVPGKHRPSSLHAWQPKPLTPMWQGASWSPSNIVHTCGIPWPHALSSRALSRKGASLLSPAPAGISKSICLLFQQGCW